MEIRTYRKIPSNIADNALTIADQTLGIGYLNESYFSHQIQELFVAVSEGQLLGFLTIKQTGPSYCMDCIAVHPKHQNSGIGKALIQTTLNKYNKVTLDIFLWMDNGSHRLTQTLRGYGFNEHAILPQFWAQKSIARQSTCPACGAPPCTCEAMHMRRNIL